PGEWTDLPVGGNAPPTKHVTSYLQWATSGPARVATRPPSQPAATTRYGAANQAPTPVRAMIPTPAASRSLPLPGPSGTRTPPTRDRALVVPSRISPKKPRSFVSFASL